MLSQYLRIWGSAEVGLIKYVCCRVIPSTSVMFGPADVSRGCQAFMLSHTLETPWRKPFFGTHHHLSNPKTEAA